MTDLETFRRERGLLSGDDLEAWLEVAGLSEEEWAARVLARDTGELPGPLPRRRTTRAPAAPTPLAGAAPVHEWVDGPRRCGDAALRVVCRALGVPSCGDVGEDATLADLVLAGRAAGLAAAALKASRRRIGDLPTPWIAHVDGGHWVVVHAVDAHGVVVSDPARGAGMLDRDAFEARWSGWCAVFRRVVQPE